MKDYLKKLFLVDGILLGIIGIFFFINPLESLLSFTLITGILIILVALSKMIRNSHSKARLYCIISGIIDILFGLILIFSPIGTIEMMLVFYGVWSLIRGLVNAILYFKDKTFGLNAKTIGALAAIIIGLIIILCPYVLIFAMPYIPYIIGAYFIFLAALEIYLGVQAQN